VIDVLALLADLGDPRQAIVGPLVGEAAALDEWPGRRRRRRRTRREKLPLSVLGSRRRPRCGGPIQVAGGERVAVIISCGALCE